MRKASLSNSLFMMLSVSVLALTACSPSSSNADETITVTNKTSAPMPPITDVDVPEAVAPAAPMALSDSDTLTPVLATSNAGPMPPVAGEVKEMLAPLAANATIEDRVARLEESVGGLRTDFDRIMPAFASLNTTNERITQLLDQIERETGARPAAATDAPTTAAALSPAKPVVTTYAAAPETAAQNIQGAVTGVRIGEHGNKTRLVFDLTSAVKPEFKYDLDNAEKMLVFDMPQSGWEAQPAGKTTVSPLVSGWTAQKSPSGGTMVAVQLKGDARVLSTEYLKAEGKDPARLVVDIAAGT